MLEGKELNTPIGKYGNASVDLNDKLELEVAVAVKIDLFAEVVTLTKKTGTPLDDAAAAFLGKMFGRSPDEVVAAHAAVVI